jgi:hypothetical protein
MCWSVCETSGRASCEHTLSQANEPLQAPQLGLFAPAIDEQCLCLFIYFVPNSHFFIGCLAISHSHLSLFHTMYTYWIPFIRGVFSFSLYSLSAQPVLNCITSPLPLSFLLATTLSRRNNITSSGKHNDVIAGLHKELVGVQLEVKVWFHDVCQAQAQGLLG